MRLLMKKTVDGARDGMKTEKFIEGQSYDFHSEGREADLAGVFVREGWAEKVGVPPAPAPSGTPNAPPDTRPLYRLPLVEEYVAHGYSAEQYAEFLKKETDAAEAKGFRVEVRAMNEDELAAEKADRDLHAAREAEIEIQRAAREAEKAAAGETTKSTTTEAAKPTEEELEEDETTSPGPDVASLEGAPPPDATHEKAAPSKPKSHRRGR